MKTNREIGEAIINAFNEAFPDADLQAAIDYLFGLDEDTIDYVCWTVALAARRAIE